MATYKKQIEEHMHRAFAHANEYDFEGAVESLTCAIERCWAVIEDLYQQLKTNAAKYEASDE
jgi:hypothetical protein